MITKTLVLESYNHYLISPMLYKGDTFSRNEIIIFPI